MLLEGLVIPVSFDTGLLLKGIELIKGAITGIVDKSQEWSESLDKLGDVTGMETNQLAAWSYVAEKAGVPVDNLSRGLVIMEKGLVKADGSLDTMGKTLAEYGIKAKDANGKVKDQSSLMGELSDKYSSFQTQQERVNFLTAVFGRSGADLVDVFDTLAQEGGIDAVTKKVQGLGLVMQPELFENIGRSLNEIGLTFTGMANTIVSGALPAVQEIINTFTGWLQSPWVVDAVKGIGETFGSLAEDISIGIATGNWSYLWDELKTIFDNGLKQLGIEGGWADYIVGSWIQSLDNSIINWVNSGGPQRMTKQLLGWVEGIGTMPEFQSATISGIEGLVKALGAAIEAADFGPLLSALNTKLGAMADGAIHDLSAKMASGVSQMLAQLGESISTWWAGVGASANGQYTHATGKNFLGLPTYGRASGGSAGGLTWVGERGPELLNLPGGSYVNNAQQSQAMQQIDYEQMGQAVARHLVPALQVAGIG